MGCGPSKDPDKRLSGQSGPEANNAKKGGGGGGTEDEPMTLAEIESRIESIEKTRTAVFGGIKIRYAYLSQRGYYPDDAHKPNQDSFSVTQNFAGQDTDGFFGVYDGHGRDGDKCAQYARDTLPDMVAKYVTKAKAREEKLRTTPSSSAAGEEAPVLELTKDQTQACCLKASVEANRGMHRNPNLDDSLSGTTSISMYIHGRRNRITVCNVGDSRAILGQEQRKPKRLSDINDGSQHSGGTGTTGSSTAVTGLKALPLSRDQTPYRRDERVRIRATGARILSLDQIEGLEPIPDSEEEEDRQWGNGDGDGDLILGEEIDEGGDPPRVWSPHGEYPGTAFTRSLGDSIAEELGVFAEPEMVTRELGADDKIIVLASDGVFEFLTNQSVIDICAKFSDPLEACRAVVAESYELWLQYELRTDDITMICMFVDEVDSGVATAYQGMSTRVLDMRLPSMANVSIQGEGDDTVDAMLPAAGSRPVRHHVSKEKTKAIEQMKRRMIKERDMSDVADDDFDLTQLYTEKTEEEKASISEAIRASVMFQNVTDSQREMIFKVMEAIDVKRGDWVIRQGSVGDRFYIVDHGKFEVRIVPEGEEDKDGSGGNVVHVYEGSRDRHAHPSFGELALMYSAPRAASIIAQTDGQLWALHRHAFRKVLAEQSERRELMKTLRRVEAFKALDKEEMESIAGAMEEATYERGHEIVKQGEVGDTFYVIASGGHCERIEQVDGGQTRKSTLKANEFFGEEVLVPGGDRAYKATVVCSTGNTTIYKLDRTAVKKQLGKLRLKRRGSNNVA